MDELRVLRHKRLNEASAAAKSNAGKLLNSFKDYQKSNAYNTLQSSNPTVKRDLDNAFSKLNTSLTNEFKNPDQVSDEEINKEINDLQALLNKVPNNNQQQDTTEKTNIDDQLKEVQKNLQPYASLKDNGDMNKIVKQYLTQLNQKSTKTIEAIQKALSSSDPQQADNKKTILEDASALVEFGKAFEDANSKLGKFDDANIDNYKGMNDEIKRNIEGAVVNLKRALLGTDDESLAKQVEIIETQLKYAAENANNPATSNNSQEDYKAELLKVAGTARADEVLNKYFKQELPDISIEKLQALGGTFEQELLKKGFAEASNPFISFVKHYLGKQGQSLTERQYMNLHNAYIDGLIDDNDLRGKGVLGENNLIFNPDLYNKTWDEFSKLLRVQKLYNNPSTLEEEITNDQIKDAFGDLGDPKNTNRANFLTALLYKGADMPKRKFAGANPKGPINSIDTINSILQWCGGGQVAQQEPPQKQNWQLAMQEGSFHTPITKQNASEVMSAIINRYADPRTMVNLNQKYKLPDEVKSSVMAPWVKDLDNIAINKNNYQNILAELDKKRQEQ